MRFVLGVGLAGCLSLAWLTHHEAQRWQTDATVWCAAVTQAPDKPRPLINCALALMRRGASDQALPLLDRAAITVEQRPDNRKAALRSAIQANRVLALLALQRVDEARQAWAQLDTTDPRAVRMAPWIDP